MVLFIALFIILVLFFVIRPIANSKIETWSSEEWNRILSIPNSNEGLKSLNQTSNTKKLIIDIMLKYKIDHTKYTSNLLFLFAQGNEAVIKKLQADKNFTFPTKSIFNYKDENNRPPHIPRWVLAAIPDIVIYLENLALSNDEVSAQSVIEKLYESYEIDEVKESMLRSDRFHEEHINKYSILIGNYLKNVKPYIETQ